MYSIVSITWHGSTIKEYYKSIELYKFITGEKYE